ncbi:MAG: polysaccharide pyruvyl transferase family protein [Bacteroidales bacterium]|nr:polysaccharide pyruvyl transferase family protein [Bacteroidales bacterium]
MKNGLLVDRGPNRLKNIGDYIQSLAQEQYYDKIDCYVQRESLNTFQSDEPVKVIMNSWFMHEPTHWPPSDNLVPLFVSFHINPGAADTMLSPEGIEYLRKHEPIGTRDESTREILEKHGIKAYFTGCLTLTLGRKYRSAEHGDKVYFVDPYFERFRGKSKIAKLWNLLIDCCAMPKYRKPIAKLLPKFENCICPSRIERVSKRFAHKLDTYVFYRTYSTLFSDETLFNAEYVTHMIDKEVYDTEEKRMDLARELVKAYAQARLVVTSRIHCGLPCLGLETPVIFVNSNSLENDVNYNGRFQGLMDLFHQMTCVNRRLDTNSTIVASFLNDGNIVPSKLENLTTWKVLADALIKTCTHFTND